MITQYIEQSAAIKQSVTGQPQYILCNIPTGVPMCQASQGPTVPWVSSPALSAASGSQIQTMMIEAPTNLSQYSLTDLGNVSRNLSGGAPTLLPQVPY